jgi:hypothetical protein
MMMMIAGICIYELVNKHVQRNGIFIICYIIIERRNRFTEHTTYHLIRETS